MTLTIDLPENEVTVLTAKAQAEGVSTEEYARLLLKQALASGGARKPLSARIREIWADMPDEVRAKLPADGASQHDHYIYGVPKRAQ
jgi:plasmid stability protein